MELSDRAPRPIVAQGLLANLINGIGNEQFGNCLMDFLHEICGAEHCAVLHLGSDAMAGIAIASVDQVTSVHNQFSLYQKGWWRRDPMMKKACQQLDQHVSSVVRSNISEICDDNFVDKIYRPTRICDRILICSKSKDGIVGISILRSDSFGKFSTGELLRAEEYAAAILAAIAKHSEFYVNRPSVSTALTSFAQIESCVMSDSSPLRRREAQVCARMIYGISTVGIALELGIGEETVMTYRKRAYQRLGIASRRELLIWYLSLWNICQSNGSPQIAH